MHQSESAWIVMVRNIADKQEFVMKMLRSYKDMRYSLGEINERQQCQVEALEWNRRFTPGGIYLGLAPYNMDLNRKLICIGKTIECPTKEMLDPTAEYALVMHKLPEDRRLDCLLSDEDDCSLWPHLRLLVHRVAHMHANLTIPSLSDENGIAWGSFQRLREKLTENLAFLDFALKLNKNGLYDDYYKCFKEKEGAVPYLLAQSYYPQYFEHRVQEQRIRRCHGDLKAPNIWIAPYNQQRGGKFWKSVQLLDAIDFNPLFCNIDILSDFAMLVIDVQMRMKTPDFANRMVDEYLQLTQQQDEVSRAVLDYYLVEKAIVGAAVSIVDDKLPSFSRAYLEVAKMRLDDLYRDLEMQPISLCIADEESQIDSIADVISLPTTEESQSIEIADVTPKSTTDERPRDLVMLDVASIPVVSEESQEMPLTDVVPVLITQEEPQEMPPSYVSQKNQYERSILYFICTYFIWAIMYMKQRIKP